MTEASLRQKRTMELAAKAAAEKEAAIINALPRVFRIAEALARCDCVVTLDKVETYRLDGVPFIEFHPLEYKTVNDHTGFKMIVTRKYRVLNSEKSSNAPTP